MILFVIVSAPLQVPIQQFQAVFADLHDFPPPDDLARLGMRVAHEVWSA
jgi:hypothetical protein